MLKQRAIWSFTLPVPPTPILNRNVLTKTPSLLGTFYSWESMAMEKFWGSFSWKNSQSFIFFVTLCAQSCLKNCPLGAAEGPCSVGLSLYYSFVKLTLKWPQLPTLGNASPPALAIFLLCTWPFQETSLQRKKANQQGKMDKRQLGGTSWLTSFSLGVSSIWVPQMPGWRDLKIAAPTPEPYLFQAVSLMLLGKNSLGFG